MTNVSPGMIVRLRDREWVVQPSDDKDFLNMRPLLGSPNESISVYLPLGLEQPEVATFAPPTPDQAGDLVSAQLLYDAARLSLRSGAGPFRSLGRLSVRPRPYQFVPLLMALRLDPVRLLIADDVGIGKTVEAGLIAREMLDRGEARRLAVLCPPHLCAQWQKELEEKFHLPAVVIRSGTVSKLERELPSQDVSIFAHFDYMVISIDYAKSDARRQSFLLHCPDLVIVDEAHTATRPAGRSAHQQQRHELLRALAENQSRHLLMLTATPHSGVRDSFRSLLGLLKPEFGTWELHEATEAQRIALAKHFVQRQRADVQRWLGEETPFPKRIPVEQPYLLSPAYQDFFNDVYDFAREIVRSGETLSGFKRRVRYWTALALLRSVMSSPAAAKAALEGRTSRIEAQDEDAVPDDDMFSPYVYDNADTEESSVDTAPSYIATEHADDDPAALGTSERKRLRDLTRRVEQLLDKADRKIEAAASKIRDLLEQGRNPIVYCRYIATANYVAEELERRLGRGFKHVRIISVTGELPEEERLVRVEDLIRAEQRVLVATDCLSEGINLQHGFDAVMHYDLPWNPNRLEQREGRVDRYGQRATSVEAVLLYGENNPIDGAVLDVLLKKAVKIEQDLGVRVPVPVDSESIMEAVLQSLLLRGDTRPQQAMLPGFDHPGLLSVADVHTAWEATARAERESRTRFAQRAIKPAEVERELSETDTILGDPQAVTRFMLNACQRLGMPLVQKGEVYKLTPEHLSVEQRMRLGITDTQHITFVTPPRKEADYIGRNHPLVSRLAEYILASALAGDGEAALIASRCAVVRTNQVKRRTTLLVLRLRHHLIEAGHESLAEECHLAAFVRSPNAITWLAENDVKNLMQTIEAVSNVRPELREATLTEVLGWLESQEMTNALKDIAAQRAATLEDAHKRIRQTVRLRQVKVKPAGDVDVLGVYVLMPMPT